MWLFFLLVNVLILSYPLNPFQPAPCQEKNAEKSSVGKEEEVASHRWVSAEQRETDRKMDAVIDCARSLADIRIKDIHCFPLFCRPSHFIEEDSSE